MNYEQTRKLLQDYFLAVDENHKKITNKYKDKCNMVIDNRIKNPDIRNKLKGVVEENIRNMRRQIVNLFTKLIKQANDFIANAKAKNKPAIIPDAFFTNVSKTIRNEFDICGQNMRHSINRNVARIIDFGFIDRRTIEDFQSEFNSVSRKSIDTLFDNFSFDVINKEFLRKNEELKKQTSKEEPENKQEEKTISEKEPKKDENVVFKKIPTGATFIINNEIQIDFLYVDNKWIIKYGKPNYTKEYKDDTSLNFIFDYMRQNAPDTYNIIVSKIDSLRELIYQKSKNEIEKLRGSIESFDEVINEIRKGAVESDIISKYRGIDHFNFYLLQNHLKVIDDIDMMLGQNQELQSSKPKL